MLTKHIIVTVLGVLGVIGGQAVLTRTNASAASPAGVAVLVQTAKDPNKVVQVQKTSVAGPGTVPVACKDIPGKLVDYRDEIERLSNIHNNITDRASKVQLRADVKTLKEAVRNIERAQLECN